MMMSSAYVYYGDKPGRSYEYDDVEQDWGRVFRLVFVSGLATLASIGNIFTISGIIGDDLLRKKGNSFLASITLADLLITTLVLPASSVAILGEMEDSENICRLQYGVGTMSCLTAAMFTAAIGIENFLRLKSLCHQEKQRERQMKEAELQQTSVVSKSPGGHRGSATATTTLLHPSSAAAANPHYQHHGIGHGLHHHNQHSSSSQASPQQQHQQPQLQQPPPPLPLPPKTSICTVFQLTLLNLKMWFVSGAIVLIHFIFLPQLMYSICGKSKSLTTTVGELKIPKSPSPINQELLLKSVSVLGICIVSLISLGGLGFLKCAYVIRSWKKPKPYLTSREFALVSSNCWNCLVRFLIWTPSIVSVSLIQFGRVLEEQQKLATSTAMSDYGGGVGGGVAGAGGVSYAYFGGGLAPMTLSLTSLSSDSASTTTFSASASASSSSTAAGATSASSLAEYAFLHRFLIWPIILPSCLSSLVNIVTNRDFRRCYVQLFHYCCCKTSVALSRRPRESTRSSSDVRVHIIPGYNMYSSGGGGGSHEISSNPQPRFTTFKFGSRSHGGGGGGSGGGGGGGKRDVYEL